MGDFNQLNRGRACMLCSHCLDECCDCGQCERRLHAREPSDFEDWSAVLDYLDTCRVDMMEDTCVEWEGCL